MTTFKTGAIPAATYLNESRSSWNHSTNVGRLRYQFKKAHTFVHFPAGQTWWLQRSNADGDRRIQQIDLEEDRIRVNIASAAGSDGADLSTQWENNGEIGIIANGKTYRYFNLGADNSDPYSLAISQNFLTGWQNFIEGQILSRNPFRDSRDVNDVEFVFWDGLGTNPFALPSAQAPTVGVNAIPDTNEGATVQVSATETGGLYDTITRSWSTTNGTIVQDDTDPKLAQWTPDNISTATAKGDVKYQVDVAGTGTNAEDGTTDSASATHQATIINVLSAATAPDSVIIDVVNLVEQDAGHTVKLTATITGGTYDSLQYQWRIKNNSLIPQRDMSDTALDGTDLTSPTLTYFVPPDTVAFAEGQVELTVTAVGTGTLADNNTTATASATAVTFKTWHPVALAEWASPTPLGALDSDDAHLSSAQEGHEVRLFAIRKADTGRFDDVEIDWEYSVAVDDSDNRVWINLDDEVDDDPFAWTLPSVDADTPSIIRARFRVSGTGTNARNGTESGWSAWRELSFTILTFHVKAPTNVTLSVAHNSGPDAGNADTVFEAGSTVRMAAVYDADGAWDTRQVVWGYIHNNNAVINAATSVAATSAIVTMPNPTEQSGDWDIWLYLEVIFKGTGTNARANTSVTKTYYIKDIKVRYPRPDVRLPTSLQIAVDGTAGVPDGNEGTTVTIGLLISGGTYDSFSQEWSVLLGTDNIWGGDDSTEEIDWTRPNIAVNTRYTIACRTLFKGDGTKAKDGSEKVRTVNAMTTVINVATTGIHIGTKKVTSIYYGDKQVTSVYLGDKLIQSF